MNSSQPDAHQLPPRSLRDYRTPEEREIDERYSTQLAQREVLNNLRHRIKSLQELAADIVANIVANCAENKTEVNPLDGLPGPIITLVKNSIDLKDEGSTFDYVKYLITEMSHELTLKFCINYEICEEYNFTSKKQVNLILELLNKCKNKLIKLKIEIQRVPGVLHPTLSRLNDVVRHQSSLRELDLSDCGIDNETMAIIGSTCHNLSSLIINNNKKVKDKGLLYLCVSDDPHGKCTKIRDLSIKGTSTTYTGITMAMSKLPELESINCSDSINKCYLIVTLCENNPTLVLPKFKKLHIDSNMKNQREIFPKVIKMLPNVLQIQINTDINDIAPLLMSHYSYIKSINITLSNINTYDQTLPNLLAKYKDILTDISIRNELGYIVQIDLGVFALCPNLEKLFLNDVRILPESQYELLPSSFSKLSIII